MASKQPSKRPTSPKKTAKPKRNPDPMRQALRSTDAELDAAAEITADDIAMLTERAPGAIWPYLTAEPDDDEDDDATT